MPITILTNDEFHQKWGRKLLVNNRYVFERGAVASHDMRQKIEPSSKRDQLQVQIEFAEADLQQAIDEYESNRGDLQQRMAWLNDNRINMRNTVPPPPESDFKWFEKADKQIRLKRAILKGLRSALERHIDPEGLKAKARMLRKKDKVQEDYDIKELTNRAHAIPTYASKSKKNQDEHSGLL